ncbi:MAG TPA: hypothetical protein G4N94_10125 [Caldilineae bacterium]|nr:hypothetical protein [Caldilineae bacterium]
MHRFFVTPDAIQGEQIRFDSEQARQLRNMLRMGAGERLLALDGGGRRYRVELTYVGKKDAMPRDRPGRTGAAHNAGSAALSASAKLTNTTEVYKQHEHHSSFSGKEWKLGLGGCAR